MNKRSYLNNIEILPGKLKGKGNSLEATTILTQAKVGKGFHQVVAKGGLKHEENLKKLFRCMGMKTVTMESSFLCGKVNVGFFNR